MQPVDFFKLPRAVQDRIVGGMRGEFPPNPLARRPAKPFVPWIWFGLCALGFSGWILLFRLGYGALSAHGRQGAGFLLATIVAAFAMFLGIVSALAAFVRIRLFPYPRGTFLYGARILFTEQHPLRTLAFDANTKVQAGPSGVVVGVGGQTVDFPCGAMEVNTAVNAISAVVSARAANPDAEIEFVDEQDPLHQPRFASPFGESEPIAFRVPTWIRFGWAIALGVAVIMAPISWGIRNGKSDAKMFQRARELDSVQAYRDYLAFGKSHRGEVERVLLPRAELREAVQAGTPDAILAFEREHPGVAIGAEVQSAKRAALLAELARREEAGNLGAVRGFSKEFPGAGLEAEVAVAVGRLYRKVGEKLRGKSPEGALLLSAALQYAEKHGPEAQFVWRNKPSKTLPNLEKVLVRVPEYMGEPSRPSKHYEEQELTRRGGAFGEAFAKELAALVPSEYLSLQVVNEAKDSAPTLSITETLEWSGFTFRSKKPRGVFVGMQFNYDVALSVPGNAKSYKQRFVVVRRPSDALLKDKSEGALEEGLYRGMLGEAHQDLQKKLATALLQ